MSLHNLQNITSSLSNTPKMPVLFLGHGSPMNAIEENEFVASFRQLGKEIPKPNAILCISAHWETKGTFVTAMQNPPTIHDFGGFPKALFDVQYPAPGSPELAVETQKLVTQTEIGLDEKWGLDHGAWSVIKHMYPDANVPVIQMSIDYSKPAQYHYELATEIQQLRHKGVLIVGSGNMVHNLRRIAWDKMNAGSYGFDWAIEANEKMKAFILNDNHKDLINFNKQGSAFNLSIPTPEHYMPLIYSLALKDRQDDISIFNNQYIGGSLSMTSVKIA
ncbi:4,5-DOPA-extradiol-dioxygenase [Wenyingzhuangia sp. IMCC45467]